MRKAIIYIRAPWVFLLAAIIGSVILLQLTVPRTASAQQTSQRVVENVDVQGNRRLRDEDLLYYVITRQGEPYNEEQVRRDLLTLLSLGFFDKTETRVLLEDAPRGGVNVIFDVRELPIIRDLQFEGMKSVTEADVLKQFREQRVGVSKESIFDPVKVNNAKRVIKELLAASGHPNATIDDRQEEVSQTSTAITFVVNEGERVRVVDIQFEGNQVFKSGQLRGAMKYVREAGLITRFKGQDILDRRKLDADLHLVQNYMRSKGYLQARTGEPRIEGIGRRTTGFFIPLPLLSSTDEALRITVPVIEGKLYRLGDLKIEGNSIYSEQVIRAVIGAKAGDVANGERIYKSLFEDLKKLYGRQGFIQYSPDLEPTFKDSPQNPKEGIVDFKVTIDEGKQFTLRRLEFLGNTFTRDNVLRREVLVNEGDIYDQTAMEYSVLLLNQLGFFDPVDKEKDLDFRQNEEEGLVDVNVKVTERGRQQISFNGGLSGIGGSFFGLEYSTNNLLGRGESLSFNLAAGNRQRSFIFSFTEPYLRNRPITAGFSIFTQSLKFFGEGTFLSQNLQAQQGLAAQFGLGNPLDFFNTNEENLFTQTSTGASIFLTSRLSEFYRKRPFTQSSRVGLSYTISRTSVKDPTINRDVQNGQNFIPVIYRQPNIITSRVTPSFVYDTRNASIDPTQGKQIALTLAFAGTGGDVRTYEPTASYTHFIPVRGKERPHVFGYRLLAGYVSSFATSSKVRAAQASSISFINGVPIYERFFLGDEFTIRGYNVRSIGPIAPLDVYVSSRNVVVASNATDAPVSISSDQLQSFARLGVLTGPTGANSRLITRSFTPVGGDTQLLGNFEYRVPLIGPASIAAFVDIGSAFNLRKGRDQTFSTNFLADQPYLSTLGFIQCRDSIAATSLSSLAACASGSNLAFLPGTGGLVARDNRLVTQEELDNAARIAGVDPTTGLPFGFQQVFLRGEAQTNTVVRLPQSVFSKIGDYRSSLGVEFRIQLPVVNVPFRLIYAFNPNARRGLSNELPGVFFGEKKSVFRFSIGRTF